METNMQDQKAENEMPEVTENENFNPGIENDNSSTDSGGKKKYHSSALYAARLAHNPVGQVKPTHGGINL